MHGLARFVVALPFIAAVVVMVAGLPAAHAQSPTTTPIGTATATRTATPSATSSATPSSALPQPTVTAAAGASPAASGTPGAAALPGTGSGGGSDRSPMWMLTGLAVAALVGGGFGVAALRRR